MKTSLIIVDYKTMDETVAYLERCSKAILDWRDVSIVIIDNNQELDDGRVFLNVCKNAKKIDNVQKVGMWQGTVIERPVIYVKTLSNLGLAKGNNMGAAIANKYFEPDFFLFSNNDIQFPKPISLTTLQQPFADNSEVGAVGPGIITKCGESQNPGKYMKYRRALHGCYWNMLLPKFLQKNIYSEWINQEEDGFCDYVSGSFFLIDRKKYVEAKGFDPGTFLYMEMPILSMRMEKVGYRMYYTNKVQVMHAQRPESSLLGGPIRHLRAEYQSKQHFYIQYGHLSMLYACASMFSFEIFFSLFWIKKNVLNIFGIKE